MLNLELVRPGNFVMIGLMAVAALWLLKPLMRAVDASPAPTNNA
jgi:hypothetical protein